MPGSLVTRPWARVGALILGDEDGTDKLDVSAWGATSVDDLLWYDDNGNAVILLATDTSVSVTLNGVDANVLDASDFIFASAPALAA